VGRSVVEEVEVEMEVVEEAGRAPEDCPNPGPFCEEGAAPGGQRKHRIKSP
jgi:hypothetical protein